LLSPCNYNPSNGDHDDDVMSLDESNPTPKIDLHVIPSKLIIQKNNNDVSRKFQDFWATKPLWAKFYLGSNGSLHTVKYRIYNEVEGKDKIFATKWDSLCKHASQKEVERNNGTNVKMGD